MANVTAADAPQELDRLDRASDWCNPILVKEVRQALKSRAFVATFLLLLLGCWLISAFGLLAAGPAIEYGRVGQWFFVFYFGVLLIALIAVVPFGAFRSLLNERDDNTYELLSVTTLSPGQIVRGKWACALVQALLFYSAIAPFIAFTSLLQGFDFAQAALLLAGALYGSAALSITSLMLSTTVRQRVWQGFLSLAVLSGLLTLTFMSLSGLSGLILFPLPVDDADFWWMLACVLAVTASYQWLFYQIAAARLTFESENRSTGIRLTASAQFWLLWLLAAAFHRYRGAAVLTEEVEALVTASGIHWAVLGLSFAAEPEGLSRRIRRNLPRRAWLRPWLVPLLPGGARGYVFVLLHAIALWFLAAFASGWLHGGSSATAVAQVVSLLNADTAAWSLPEVQYATAVCLYLALYTGLAGCFHRWGHAILPAFQGAHARTLIVILVAGGFILPFGVRTARLVPFGGHSVVDVAFPFWILFELLSRETATAAQMWTIAGLTAAVVGLNLPAVVRGVREVLAGPHRSASRPHVAPGIPAGTAWEPKPA
jgi:hypothetical protein